MGNTIVQLRDPFSSGLMVAEENPVANMSAPNKLTQMNAPAIFDTPRLVGAVRHQRLDPGSDTVWAKLRARERDSEHRIGNEHCIERSHR
jgi:hypothetical protein